MKNICFATGNKGKVATLGRYFKKYDVLAVVEQCPLDIAEVQADTAKDVAIAKARRAYEILKKPVLVDDSSFHITVLGGFPGPYIKYMLSTIGIDGIMQFMKNNDDRSAYFLSALVFIDEDGEEYVFEDEPFYGNISEEIIEIDNPESWSELYKVFVPNGTTKVLGELSADERAELNTAGDSYAAFAQWMKSRNSKWSC